jgi:hypothetical protein
MAKRMRDGLYKVEFKTPLGFGSGVVHLLTGRMWGGDAALYYLGNLQEEGNRFKATVRVDRHTHQPGITSVFGMDRVTINLDGTSTGDLGTANGVAKEAPGVPFQVKFKRIAD